MLHPSILFNILSHRSSTPWRTQRTTSSLLGADEQLEKVKTHWTAFVSSLQGANVAKWRASLIGPYLAGAIVNRWFPSVRVLPTDFTCKGRTAHPHHTPHYRVAPPNKGRHKSPLSPVMFTVAGSSQKHIIIRLSYACLLKVRQTRSTFTMPSPKQSVSRDLELSTT